MTAINPPAEISAEQCSRAVKQASLMAQIRLHRFTYLNPTATREQVETLALELIEAFGRASAKFACTYYMNQRRSLGIEDGWRILPSRGEHPQTLKRWINRDYDPNLPLRGLRGVIDTGVKAHARRTLTRRRGVIDDNHSGTSSRPTQYRP